MSGSKGFPILGARAGGNSYLIPWEFVAPHDNQAQRNHSQTLKRLAERGGLSWCELRAVIESRPWAAGKEDDDRNAVLSAVTRWKTCEAIAVGIEVDAAITTIRAALAAYRKETGG